VLTPLIMLSGMAMSPQLNQAFHWLPAMFGGRQSARTVHFVLTFAFAGFVFGHVFMVLTTGLINNMRSMITGWYREKIAAADAPPPRALLEPEMAPSVPGPAAEQSGVNRAQEQSAATTVHSENAAENTGGKNEPE
jgi:hypothetical protein